MPVVVTKAHTFGKIFQHFIQFGFNSVDNSFKFRCVFYGVTF